MRARKSEEEEDQTHLDVTSLGRDQRHDHLHDLDLSVDLSGVEVISRLDEELDDLSRRGRSELSAEEREVEEKGSGSQLGKNESEEKASSTHGSFSCSIKQVFAST